MPEEATLDAFVQDDDEGDEDDDAAADADAATSSEASVETDTIPATEERVDTDANEPGTGERGVEPSPVTSSWTGDESVCSSCGEPAGRLWPDGTRRVCVACKPWARTGEDSCDQ